MYVEFMGVMEFADISTDGDRNKNGSQIESGRGFIRTDWTE